MQLKAAVSEQDHTQGPQDAPVTLVEYGDYQCPHCAKAHAEIKRLQKHFGNSLLFAFRNFPLTQMHPLAQAAAEAAEFAASQNKFWEMHDGIFQHQTELSIDLLKRLATQNGIDAQALANALGQGDFAERVKSDFLSGVRSGVNGTPTFFLNGQRHDTQPDFDSLSANIQALL